MLYGTNTYTYTGSISSFFGNACCGLSGSGFCHLACNGLDIVTGTTTIDVTLDCANYASLANVNGASDVTVTREDDGHWVSSSSVDGGTRTVDLVYGSDDLWVLTVTWASGDDSVHVSYSLPAMSICCAGGSGTGTVTLTDTDNPDLTVTGDGSATITVLDNLCCKCSDDCRGVTTAVACDTGGVNACPACELCEAIPTTGSVTFTYDIEDEFNSLRTTIDGILYVYTPRKTLTITNADGSDHCIITMVTDRDCCGENPAATVHVARSWCEADTTVSMTYTINGSSECCYPYCKAEGIPELVNDNSVIVKCREWGDPDELIPDFGGGSHARGPCTYEGICGTETIYGFYSNAHIEWGAKEGICSVEPCSD